MSRRVTVAVVPSSRVRVMQKAPIGYNLMRDFISEDGDVVLDLGHGEYRLFVTYEQYGEKITESITLRIS